MQKDIYEDKVVRRFPHDYYIKDYQREIDDEFNKNFQNGWVVKMTVEFPDNKGRKVVDYVLTRLKPQNTDI